LDKETIKHRIYALANEFYNEVRDSRNESDLVQMYSINSIDSIEFLLTIEDEFEIEFDDDKLNINSLKDIDYLVGLVVEKTD
jgi:acyl carrier protein